MLRFSDSASRTVTTFSKALLGVSTAALISGFASQSAADGLSLERIKIFTTGIFDGSAAEIVSYDPVSQHLFVTNSANSAVDIFDLNGSTTAIGSIAIGGGGPNSVAVNNGIVAVAVEAAAKTDPGTVAFFDTSGAALQTVTVGALPDMLTFSPDGTKVLVANEGEPNGVNPLGTVSILDIAGGVELGDPAVSVTNVDFTAFNGAAAALKAEGANFSPGATVAEDVEPEYIAVSEDGNTAFVVMQETNTIGVIDIPSGVATDLFGLGLKDYMAPGNALDPSDRDDAIAIAQYPVFGLYQPDAIATYEVGGTNYIVTVNEGDARDGEDVRVKDITLDPAVFTDPNLQDDDKLGRLEIVSTMGQFDDDGDAEYETLFTYGGRSFSIYDEDGNLIFDSGDDLEQIIAAELASEFNSTNDENGTFDSRSDAKGPEPEALVLAMLDGKMLAFIGLERVGGIAVYDITDPTMPSFLTYQNERDFSLSDADLLAGLGNGLGPEGMTFIAAADSDFGVPLLIVANEVSGTTEVYEIDVPEPGLVASVAIAAGGLMVAARRRRTRQ